MTKGMIRETGMRAIGHLRSSCLMIAKTSLCPLSTPLQGAFVPQIEQSQCYMLQNPL